MIVITADQNQRNRVLEDGLLLATFSSRKEAEEYARITLEYQGKKGSEIQIVSQ